MARVFISYAREDQAAIRPLAEGLEQARHDVWWDVELRGGDRFRDVIEQQLEDSDIVLVVWSQRARLSRFVMDEAEVGVRDGKLLPVRIDPARLPLGFGGFNVLNFTDWGGDYSADPWRRLLDEIDRVAAGPSPARPRPQISVWRHSLAVAAGHAGAFGIVIWALYSRGPSAPTSGLMGHPLIDCLALALLGSAPIALWSGVEVKRAGFDSARLVLRRSLIWLRRGGMVAMVILLIAIAAGAVREHAPRAIAIELGRILMVATLFSAAIMAAFNLLLFLMRQLIGTRTG